MNKNLLFSKKSTLFLLASMLFTLSSFSQDNFSMHFSQTYSWFRYTDSEGNVDENMESDIRYSYALNYNKILPSGIYIRPELGYKNLGANSLYNTQKLHWSLHYLDFNLGAGYIFDQFRFQPFAGASLYAAYLFKAEQNVGGDYYNMIKEDAIKRMDFGFNLHVGVLYSFTKQAMVFLQATQSTGLSQLDVNQEGQNQKLNNRAFMFHMGLAFTIDN